MNDDAPIPQDINARYLAWQKLWTDAAKGHYYLGVASVASSSIAAVVGGFNPTAGQIFAALAAVLTAMLGFSQA
ncbi:hypothetical protein EN871_29255 [bacterium M00.F.Ca.ET.228.01.1.1]|nr:hypothetical protein EN871_29255 [bacterium M00.F.Ca.ET.228.01.1.1]TGR96541.1 hypothetical protein EN834_28305 [bacterium M00.F.Ca.ET.191.01.1.1]TGT97777.1 hypothetical protein EN798_28310 [bacterium M00.F.Ca.ET.155.01.1.1]